MLTKFSEYIVEKMGILTTIDPIVDDIIKEFNKKSHFIFDTIIDNKKVKIECELTDNIKDTAHIRLLDKEESKFLLQTTTLNRSTIKHELKHIHYLVVRNFKNQKLYTLSKQIIDYKYKKVINYLDCFKSILYYSSPDEFESFFNDMYEELLVLTKDKKDKKEIIDNYLLNHELFVIYKSINEINFTIENWFHNRKFLSDFINDYDNVLSDINKGSEATIKNYKFLEIQFSKLLYYFKKNDTTNKQNKIIKNINNFIKKNVYKNYKKIFRLYTLILDDVNINESNSRWYRNYEIIKNPLKTAGEDGLWSVPELYWMKYGNKIQKGFETISIIQSKEAIDKWFDFSEKTKKIYEASYNDVLKYQQIGDPSSDILFSAENSTFEEEIIDILKLRKLNNMANNETDDGYEQTLSYFKELGLDEDESITRRLFKKIVDGIELSPIVVDENYKLLDGFHRLAAYSELYFYHGYDFDFDGKLKIYKRI